MEQTTVFLELHDNGAVILNKILTGRNEVLLGRHQFLMRMGELYDTHCLALCDVTEGKEQAI